MRGFPDARLPVGIAAASGQKHSFVMKTDIVDQREPVIGDGLLKGPEVIVRRGHQQGAVFFRIFLISSQRRIGILPGDAVEAFDKCLDSGGNGPEIQGRRENDTVRFHDFGNQPVERILLDTRFSVPAGIAAQTSVHRMLQQRNQLRLVAGLLHAFHELLHQLGSVSAGPSPALNDENFFHKQQNPFVCGRLVSDP